MKPDVLIELKALRLHGMAGAWADLVEQGGGAGAIALASSPRAGSSNTCYRPRPRTARCARSATRCTRPASRCIATWQASTSRSRRWIVRSSPMLASTAFTDNEHNVVLVGEPGTGETHLAPTIGVSRISMQDQADVSDTGAGDGIFFMSIVRFSDVALHIKSRVPTPYSGIISVHSRSFRTRTQ
ncbi:MAG: hypothetical protein B7Y28_22155 [Polaromonas sp. 16-63-31]|jgi:hypothetical protein|nr:MAG: hypothetical protein B7Y60_22535 [Polaromonas sp. 35-63-35]OYZ15189.1 MAG: hypothetical protein B7Y28_22155 [Polaromonas sp. 16-63-31]OYZ75676.1 MAG: hypothetical protein B7Y09_23300 [Polaromonas sp. 24-63-21]OZA46229.1 MAG: hypothetical protein B7X88_23525 [Polaromonas sp. 17-63-33]